MKGFVGSGLQLKAADICKFGIYQSLNCAVIEKRQGFVYQKISSKENISSRIICIRNIEFYVIYIIRFHVPIFIQSGIFMIMGMDTAGCRAYNRNHIVRDAVVAPSSIIFSSAEELAREVMPILCVPHGVRNLSFFLFWRIFIQMEIFFFITYNYIKHIASRNRPTYNTVLFI